MISAVFLIISLEGYGKVPAETVTFTVSMENPNNNYYHVTMNYSGFKDNSVELNLPVWTPGYYMIMDYPKYLTNFKAFDEKGNSLVWRKTTKNRWKIATEKISSLKVSYFIYAFIT